MKFYKFLSYTSLSCTLFSCTPDLNKGKEKSEEEQALESLSQTFDIEKSLDFLTEYRRVSFDREKVRESLNKVNFESRIRELCKNSVGICEFFARFLINDQKFEDDKIELALQSLEWLKENRNQWKETISGCTSKEQIVIWQPWDVSTKDEFELSFAFKGGAKFKDVKVGDRGWPVSMRRGINGELCVRVFGECRNKGYVEIFTNFLLDVVVKTLAVFDFSNVVIGYSMGTEVLKQIQEKDQRWKGYNIVSKKGDFVSFDIESR